MLRVDEIFSSWHFLKNTFFHNHSSWRSYVLPASRMMFGALHIRKPSKCHLKVIKSLIFLAKCMVSLVRTSPIETGHSRHAYPGGSRGDADWSNARPGKSTESANHLSIAMGLSSCPQRLPAVICPRGQNIKTIHKYLYLLNKNKTI